MSEQRSASFLAGPGVMLISALLFGFFGFFFADWSTPGVDGQPVLFRILCGWTLKVSAIAFGVSAVMTFLNPFFANLLYALVGLIGAVLFVVVAVMDFADKQHTTMAYGEVILLVFAAWNGYGSFSSLRALLGSTAVTVERSPEA